MLRHLALAWLVVSLACSGDESTETESNTAPPGNEGFTLPTPPILEDGTDFSNWEVPQCGLRTMPQLSKASQDENQRPTRVPHTNFMAF